MCDFWYVCVKPKDGEEAKLCYMDTYSFIVSIKTDDIDTYSFIICIKTDHIYKGISENVETNFDSSNLVLQIMNYIDRCQKEKKLD